MVFSFVRTVYPKNFLVHIQHYQFALVQIHQVAELFPSPPDVLRLPPLESKKKGFTLRETAGDYRRLREIPEDYRRLPKTGDFRRLQETTIQETAETVRNTRRLPEITGDCRRLQGDPGD